MKILFDLSATQPFSGNDFHGGSEYAKILFLRLCKLISKNYILDVFFNPDKNINKYIFDICKSKELLIHYVKNNKEITNLIKNNNYDIFYSALPYLYYDLIIPAKTKFIYTIHGLRSLEYSFEKYMNKYLNMNLKQTIKFILFKYFAFITNKLYYKRNINKLNKLFSVTKNQTIITVSNHSKYSIKYFFPNLDINNIKVMYSPAKYFEYDSSNDAKTLDSFLLKEKKYILMICGDRSEKGAYRGVHVLNYLINNNYIPFDINVIVTGVSNFKAYNKVVKNNKRFIFKEYVSSDELECLYKNAYLFLYPTLNEGFGYPPLEAMKYGTFCACSANSSITEVYGDSVLYFNPHDEKEMGIRILQCFDENIKKNKLKKMQERIKLISEKQQIDLDLLVNDILLIENSNI